MDNVETVARTGFKGTFILMTTLTVLGLGLLAVVIHGLRQSWETERQLEAQLRHAKRLETIGTLAGGIAHDFNNILTPILGYANMALQDTPPTSETHSDIQHVIKGAGRAKDLVNQILTFSRQGEQERKLVEISEVVAEALKLLRASLPSTIEFRESIDTKCGTVLADSTQIHQVIMNLCANAFHAMKDKGGVLEVKLGLVEVDAELVRLHTNLHQGTYVRLTVSDTGRGMDSETRDRVFDPFFTTKEIGEGTGLGLSVVHGIVASHGGEITVYSEPGVGTTFHVYLPQSDGGVEEELPEEKVIATGEERVLFVDDDEEVAHMANRTLGRLGYQVTVRTDSVEARDTFRHNPDKFDIVITDQTMPKMTGVELAKELLSIRPDLPIILISGFSQMFTAEKIKSAGIREFIMKPIIASELSQTIRRVLDEEQEQEV
jgi:signal transduction histidine kinase/ActR/RegA family two-component response regulator